VFLEEGGFAIRKSEPGGAVNMGVSQDEFVRYCEANKLPVPEEGDFGALGRMSREVAEVIYGTQFLRPIRYDELPAGIDYCVLDFAINSGISGALRAIRSEYGLPNGNPSWKVEPALMAILTPADPDKADEIIDRICEARLRVMQASSSWDWARRGWVPRLQRVKARSKVLAREAVPPLPEGNAKAVLPKKGK
jgi:lysozyme family protein